MLRVTEKVPMLRAISNHLNASEEVGVGSKSFRNLHDVNLLVHVADACMYLYILSCTHFTMRAGEALARNFGQTVPRLYQRRGRPAGDAATALQLRSTQDGVLCLRVCTPVGPCFFCLRAW